jgi:glycosyltransferase involved in cell wall biosynthesis
MKILLVSMNSIHFSRWADQLKDSGHEVFWFNIQGTGYSNRLPWVEQVADWKQKYPNLKGRYFIKNKLPIIYKLLKPLIERNTAGEFEKALESIKPDVVHSFVLYISCVPIFSVMEKYKNLPWIYSSWGSDLFYFKNIRKYLIDIKIVLPRINYLITDCKRDVKIARDLGFKGKVLGTFPGGGGFEFDQTDKFIVKPASERHTIMVKGYQGRSGRSITILKVIKNLTKELNNYKVIVFGADEEVLRYAKKNKLDDLLNISIFSKIKLLPHNEIMRLMGESLIYIGNSNSDGIPNTLLEAIAMGAFPIQSNPGGVTEEVIRHKENGFIIKDHNDIEDIKKLILKALNNMKLIDRAFIINQMEIKPKYNSELIKKQVLKQYNSIK